MAMFADCDIEAAMKWGKVAISPYSDAQLQPSSYDVTLSEHFKLFDTSVTTCIDPKRKTNMISVQVPAGRPFVLHPGEFALGSTQEVISLEGTVASRFEGKSSIGRLGLLTHVTAGFIDPGFSGHITLELANVGPLPLKLWPGMKIGQLCFFDLLSPSRRPYGSDRNHYQHQEGPTASAAHLQFEEEA
jgi:dCTP deaminase